jgi:S1-C subfamily serine protease
LALAATVLFGVAACSASAGSAGSFARGGSPNVVPVVSSNTSAPTVSTLSGAAADLQNQMVAVVKQLQPAVVQIETDAGLGSGVVFDASGDIVTNAHVVGSSTTFKVTMSSGKTYPGTLVGSYTADDIAVIKINATGLAPATFADSSKLSVGDFVLAMGNPLGLQSSVTEGIVSALNRSVSEPNGATLPDTIQTSAAINPGNSGGALVDLDGQVVGIPTLAATDPQLGGSAPGIGFAISSNRASLVAKQLISSGHVTASGRAYMGVQIQDGNNGPTIVSTASGSPAEKAGLVAGDVIVSINGTATPDTASVGSVLSTLKPGDKAAVAVQHQDGTNQTFTLTLAQLPGS